MAFRDERFPDAISLGAVERLRHQTRVVVVDSGARSSNKNWAFPLREFEVSHLMRLKVYADTVVAFNFAVAEGMANTFRYKPWGDYTVTSGQGVFTDLGGGLYQMWKRYTFGSYYKDRKVTLPVAATVAVTGGGSYSVSGTTGVVTALGSPIIAPASWVGEFDVIGCFGSDVAEYMINAKTGGGLLMGNNQVLILEVQP